MNKIFSFMIFIFWGTLLYSQNIVIDGVIFSADGKTLIKYPEDKVEKEYVVPEGVEVIGKNSFMYTKYLNILTLPLYLLQFGGEKSISLIQILYAWSVLASSPTVFILHYSS